MKETTVYPSRCDKALAGPFSPREVDLTKVDCMAPGSVCKLLSQAGRAHGDQLHRARRSERSGLGQSLFLTTSPRQLVGKGKNFSGPYTKRPMEPRPTSLRTV